MVHEHSEEIQQIAVSLSGIREDDSIPKNVRIRIEKAFSCLTQEGREACLNIDEALQELDGLSNDPNLQVYIRVEILNIVSALETVNHH